MTPQSGILRSLAQRNFRLYFLGQLVSLHGTWMQNVAQAWLVYRLTESSFMLGLVSFFALLPVLLFGLFGGVVADHLPRRGLFMTAQVLAMAQALVLAALTLGGWVQPWQIVVLAFLLGVVHAFEMPARHSFIAELVPREHLGNAIGLNSSLFNVARFIGPALAGWLVVVFGEGWVFVLNAASFIAVLAMLNVMDLPAASRAAATGSTRARVIEGLRFAWQHRPIRAGLLMLGTVSLVGVPYLVLMPVFAREIFGGGAETLGFLMGAAGAGALVGALRLAQRTGIVGLERVIGVSGAAGGVALSTFALVSSFWAALPILVVVGFCLTSLVASTNAFIQLQVPDHLRGRVMSLFSVVFIGLAPIGNLAAGSLAHVTGAPFTVGLFGLLCCAAGLVFLQRIGRGEDGC